MKVSKHFASYVWRRKTTGSFLSSLLYLTRYISITVFSSVGPPTGWESTVWLSTFLVPLSLPLWCVCISGPASQSCCFSTAPSSLVFGRTGEDSLPGSQLRGRSHHLGLYLVTGKSLMTCHVLYSGKQSVVAGHSFYFICLWPGKYCRSDLLSEPQRVCIQLVSF